MFVVDAKYYREIIKIFSIPKRIYLNILFEISTFCFINKLEKK